MVPASKFTTGMHLAQYRRGAVPLPCNGRFTDADRGLPR